MRNGEVSLLETAEMTGVSRLRLKRVFRQRKKKKHDDTYSGADKAFILHTNCFAEHFVFE